MRVRFDEQLAVLHKELIIMGSLCENAIAMAAKAVVEGDAQEAKPVFAISGQIDQKEREIEAMCLKLLLQQQPVATDLRKISAALKMITDMQRIGTQSADIAEIIETENSKGCAHSQAVNSMASAVIKMVTDSVEAFVKQDLALAQAVIDYDDVVDNDFNNIKNMLIGDFSRAEADGEQTINLLMIVKYFERIGDHAVNIAQWVLFSATGNRE